MTFLPIFLPCILPTFINERKRSLEVAMGQYKHGLPAPQEPRSWVPTTRHARSAHAGQDNPANKKMPAPGAGQSHPCRQESNTRAGTAISASHVHTSALAFLTVHIWATHLTGWLHRPISPCSQGEKRLHFLTKITHFSARANLFSHRLFWLSFHVYIIKYSME